MAVLTAVLPPPQSLETLDTWGGLDALAWSLDSAVWETAGMYGLSASEAGTSGNCVSYVRKRGLAMAGRAATSCAVKGNGIVEISGKGGGASSGRLDAGRTLHVGGTAFARTAASGVFLRVSPLPVSEPALSGERADGVRVRTADMARARSASSGVCEGGRIREGGASFAATSEEVHAFHRVRTAAGVFFASACAVMEGARFYALSAAERAQSGGTARYVRIVQCDVSGSAGSSGVMSGIRLAELSGTGRCAARGQASFDRLAALSGVAEGFSGGRMAAEQKGRTWRQKGAGEERRWEALSEEDSRWKAAQGPEAADWKALCAKQGDWKRTGGRDVRRSGVTVWR